MNPTESAAVDRANAFELGFAKAAMDAGLSEAEYLKVREFGIKKLAMNADTAEKMRHPQPFAPASAAEIANANKPRAIAKQPKQVKKGSAVTDAVAKSFLRTAK